MTLQQQIVIVSGPPGVGKTTVSNALRNFVAGTVCIHGDELRSFTPDDARVHLGGGSTFRAGAALASAYLQMGAARVIFDYCFLNTRHVEYFERALTHSVRPRLFTLWASLKTVKAREKSRPGRPPLGAAVDESHHEIASNLGALGCVLDAESIAPPSLAAHIDSLAGIGSSPR